MSDIAVQWHDMSTTASIAKRESGTVVIYEDGGCYPNPGLGGWGVVIRYGHGLVEELCGGEPSTTNNRMELMSAIVALEHIPTGCNVVVHADSEYVINGATKWMAKWKVRGWMTSGKKSHPVKNQDLWERLDEAMSRHRVTFQWVKGHAGNSDNERADSLAEKGAESVRRKRNR